MFKKYIAYMVSYISFFFLKENGYKMEVLGNFIPFWPDKITFIDLSG